MRLISLLLNLFHCKLKDNSAFDFFLLFSNYMLFFFSLWTKVQAAGELD